MSRLKFRSLFPTGSLNISGSVTASYFVGDGSGLTNLPVDDISALNAFTSSANSRLDDLEAATSSYLQAANLSELNVFTGSTDSRLDSIEAATSSYLQAVDLSDLNTFTGSADNRLDSIEAATSSYLQAANLSDLNIFTGSADSRLDSLEAATSSYATIAELNSSSSILQSNLDTVSSSLAAETAQLLDFSASLDNTFATDVELNTVSASVKVFATDADTTLSASLAVDITTNASDIISVSSSVASDITTNASNIGSNTARITSLEAITGSFVTTASISDDTITITKKNGTSFDLTVNNVEDAVSSSYALTASFAENVSTPTLQQVTDEGATTTNAISGPRINIGGSGTNGVVNVYDTNSNEIFRATVTGVQIGGLSQDQDLLHYGNTTQNGNINATGYSVTASFKGDLDGNAATATTASNALTASSADEFYVRGGLTVAGRVTAEEYHTEIVSASIIYQSGSTKFGDTADDNHDFTGSLGVSGSITSVDINIDDWGSVSSSLAEISASTAAANSITLQGVTDNGSLTTNHISISSSLNVSQSIISKGEDVLDFAVAMAIALG